MFSKEVPKVLEERLLITEEDRFLLQKIDELSPKDTGTFYITSTLFQTPVPSLKQISDKIGKTEGQVLKELNRIAEIWEIPSPENLPINNGLFSKEEALISAVTNQHRLRWDKDRGDYRVQKIHILMGEMGTGTIYTNEEAYLGEKIFRQAIGIDEKLNSYIIQGGLMPEFIQTFGKAKNQRALMTGLDKSEEDDKDKRKQKEEQFEKVRKILKLGGVDVTKRDMKNLEDNVIDTLSSCEEAARSVAYQIAPLVENIPEWTPIHYQWSYNDWANMQESLDILLPKLRKAHKEMKDSIKNKPEWEKEKEQLQTELNESLIEKLVAERVYFHVNTNKSKEFSKDKEEYNKKEYGLLLEGYLKDEEKRKKLKEKVKGEFEGITKKTIEEKRKQEEFEDSFYEMINKFHDGLSSFTRLENFYQNQQRKFKSISRKINSLEDKIHEAEVFENSISAEGEVPAWFTKKIAITPTEAKLLWMITKKINKGYYDIMFSEVRKINGKDHKFLLHTDDLINIEIPDPQDLIEGKENYKSRSIGTTIVSMPRTNAQKSNEPTLNTFSELQRFHEGEISEAVKKGKVKPKKKSEHNKRDSAFGDIFLTGYGADGFNIQEKFPIDPTTIIGEYETSPLITSYIKVPTRHDTQKLGELIAKGNKGTWPAKRIVKGGNTTGIVIYIQHPDQSNESIFVDDDYLKNIGQKFGKRYSRLEEDIKNFEVEGKTEEAGKARVEMQKILDEVSPNIYKVLLQNDMHLGSYSTPGRPSNVDCITSSQLVALQTIGLNNIKCSIMTEALHGEQAWRSHDSKRESDTNDYWTHSKDYLSMMERMDMLKYKMKEKGASDKDILEAVEVYVKEFEEAKSTFSPEDQKSMFMKVLHPINTDLMENGTILYVGTGNHWMAKKDNEDEANVIATMFDKKYQEQKLLIRGQSCSGGNFSYDLFEFPGVTKEIPVVVTHKMWHGRTEISEISSQAVRTREGAVYYITADRHHYGAIAERGKMGILDVGKQTTIPYRKQIGKSASVRGTIIGGYGGNEELILSSRSYLDKIVEIISGWDYKMGILSRGKSLLDEAEKDNSLYREMGRINRAMERNKGKFELISKKYKKR